MTDNDDDLYYDDPDTKWVWLLVYDRHHPLTRYIFGVVLIALAGYILTGLLTP